jgi:hypothetical protein
VSHQRRFKRTSLVLAVFWLSGATFVWWQRPLDGRVLVRTTESLQVLGFDRYGALAVARIDTFGANPSLVGPLTFHDAQTGAELRHCIEPGAKLLSRTMAHDFVIVQNGPLVQLISHSDGRTVVERQVAQATRPRVDLSPSGGRFLVADGDLLTVHDTLSCAELWSRTNVVRAGFVGDDALVASIQRSSQDASQSPGPMTDARLDAHTGEPLDMIHRTYVDCGGGRRSPNGAYSLAFTQTDEHHPPGLYDNATGELRWAFGPQFAAVISPFGSPLHFSDDSREVRLVYENGRHRLGTARWSAADGRLLALLPADIAPRVEEAFPYFSTLDEDWSLIGHTAPSLWSRVPQSIRARLAAWWPKLSAWPEWTQDLAIVDNARDRIVGTMPKPWDRPWLTPDGKGIITPDEHEIRRYDLPPPRNEWWLLGWGIAPALSLRLLAELRSRSACGSEKSCRQTIKSKIGVTLSSPTRG